MRCADEYMTELELQTGTTITVFIGEKKKKAKKYVQRALKSFTPIPPMQTSN